MDILELLKIQEEETSPYGTYRLCKGIQVGNFTLSVQASQSHYCTPRATLPLDEYSEFEIAMFDLEGKWINPHNDEKFKEFSRLEELLDRYQDMEVAVGGWIPKDLVEDLYTYLSKLN